MTEAINEGQKVSDDTDNKGIWEKVYHTDARVTAMEGQLQEVSAGMQRIEQFLLNKPPVNIIGWITVGALAISGCIGLVYAMANYMHLVVNPFRLEQATFSKELDEFRQFEIETNHTMGEFETKIERLERLEGMILYGTY